jgi:hypothetical protein
LPWIYAAPTVQSRGAGLCCANDSPVLASLAVRPPAPETRLASRPGVTTDRRGQPYSRIVHGQLDIGAFEIQATGRESPESPTPGGGPIEPILVLTIFPPSDPHRTK